MKIAIAYRVLWSVQQSKQTVYPLSIIHSTKYQTTQINPMINNASSYTTMKFTMAWGGFVDVHSFSLTRTICLETIEIELMRMNMYGNWKYQTNSLLFVRSICKPASPLLVSRTSKTRRRNKCGHENSRRSERVGSWSIRCSKTQDVVDWLAVS